MGEAIACAIAATLIIATLERELLGRFQRIDGVITNILVALFAVVLIALTALGCWAILH